ncbi:MAG: SCO family protein [Alphaproteobacteria bacterium GM202ARS2]|nr:SCO family protein [Alphaproteobacteria bacterium GM202ARS2]
MIQPKSYLIAGIVAAFMLTALSGWALLTTHQNHPHPSAQQTALIGGVPFTLTDQHGKRRHFADYGNQHALVFFGFTHCPDVCPVALASITAALNALDAPQRKNIIPLFITTDPKRDTPQRMQAYAQQFAPEIVMLTGSQSQLQHAYHIFKVYAQKQTPQNDHHHTDHHAHHDHQTEPSYLINHSSFIYLMAPNGQFIDYFPYNVSVSELRDALRAL